jgi:hypothetical protein
MCSSLGWVLTTILMIAALVISDVTDQAQRNQLIE